MGRENYIKGIKHNLKTGERVIPSRGFELLSKKRI